jgi:hypothetical protein
MNEADDVDGLVAVWPKKQSEGKGRATVMSSSNGRRDVVKWRYRWKAFPFKVAAGLQQSSKTIRGRGRRSDPVVAARGSIMVGP